MTSPQAFTHGPETANPAKKGRIRSSSAMGSLTRSTNTRAGNSIGGGKRLMNQSGADTTSSPFARSNRNIMEGVGK